jgi:hypothetical protein
LAVFVAVVVGLLAGSASAAGNKKLVEGTVYDATCATACTPECPPIPCGPITQAQGTKVICAYRRIVCPLARRTVVCVKAPCPGTDPLYQGEGAIVKVRKRGSSTVLTTVPVTEGHFKVRLAPGEYMMRPFFAEPQCWSGTKVAVLVSAELQGPLPASLWGTNSCVVQPGTAK